jgi:DHA1 family bicyclomycin/chloramphenicol resistance-like MFS transporter
VSQPTEPPAWLRSSLRLGLALGLLSAVGPLSIDLYLPAFPQLAHDLSASPGEVQRTLSAFFLALAFAQVPIGSFGDRFGRKLPLTLGFSFFILFSILCALSPSIDALILLRFLQGFAICAGTAVSRAMIRDLRSGPEAARLMAVSFLIIGISPILAPIVGSLLLTFMPWRGLFLVLAAFGLLGLLVTRLLPETLPPERRLPRGTPLLAGYGALMRNRRFLAAALVTGLATTVPYAYVTAAPFIFSGLFALEGHEYGLLLAMSALCSIATTQVAPNLMRRWGAGTVLVRISAAAAALTLLMAALTAMGVGGLPLVQAFSMILFGLAGLLLTPAAISALDASGSGAGAAAGLLGTLQLVVTALASATISFFPAFSLFPLLGVVGGALLIALLLSLVSGPVPERH